MKAHELIALLRTLPPDTDVLIYDEEKDVLPICQVTVESARNRRFADRIPKDTTDKFWLIC